MIWKRKKEIIPLPFPVYAATLAALTFLGVLNALYLVVSHYRVYTDIGYESFCALSKAINCDTVAESPYSIFMGAPVAFWGLLGYIGFGLIWALAWRKESAQKRFLALLVLIGWIFCIISIFLAYISAHFIHSYCIMCILSYAINFALLFFAWLTRRRFNRDSWPAGLMKDISFLMSNYKTAALWGLPFLLLTVAAVINYPPYWHLAAPVISRELKTGVTEDGHPWIGGENPEITIIEFSDYLCFQCKKMHFILRKLISQNPKRIRLVIRHFPMDNSANPIVQEPFHIGAAKLARIAIYAEEHGKFWEMNDLLFSEAGAQGILALTEIAARTGLDANQMASGIFSPVVSKQLRSDIISGLQLKLTGTPGFLINGSIYEGQIPAQILEQITK